MEIKFRRRPFSIFVAVSLPWSAAYWARIRSCGMLLCCWWGLEEILKHSSSPWRKGNIEQKFYENLKLSLCKVWMEVEEEDTLVRVCDLLWPWYAKLQCPKRKYFFQQEERWLVTSLFQCLSACGTGAMYKSKSTPLHSRLWTKIIFLIEPNSSLTWIWG